MSDIINIYTTYSVRELRDLLIASVRVGDAGELHNACIALCDLVIPLSNAVERQEKRIELLEARKPE